MNKRIDAQALKNLGKNADVVESVALENNAPTRISRLKPRKIYRSYSLSMPEEDYIKFLNYLDDHHISSGSAFIRDILKEKEVI